MSDQSDLRERIAEALTAEHYRRARAQIVASPEEHSAALADAVINALHPTVTDGRQISDLYEEVIRYWFGECFPNVSTPALLIDGIRSRLGGFVTEELIGRERRIAELEAELAILQAAGVDPDETLLTGISGSPGEGTTISLRPPAEILKVIVTSLIAMLDNASNYIEMQASEADSPDRYVVRVQRAEGKTPHEARQEAEARARAAEALAYRRWLAYQSARRGRVEATAGLDTVLDDLRREDAYAKELETRLATICTVTSSYEHRALIGDSANLPMVRDLWAILRNCPERPELNHRPDMPTRAPQSTRAAPNPYSPYADANPDYRHTFTAFFSLVPKPGSLAVATCGGMAVVPTEPLREVPDELSEGLCPACLARARGEYIAQAAPITECRECGADTRHADLCALCRQEKHEAWRETP